jgi:hypothetical protein
MKNNISIDPELMRTLKRGLVMTGIFAVAYYLYRLYRQWEREKKSFL